MPKALLSVHDKTGLVPFARALRELGWTLIASGGTAKLLRENDILVIDVADYTGSPEILGGRVKTLHPAIHGGLLARPTDSDRADLSRISAEFIDLAAVNLYPFEQTIAKPNVTLDEAIENIDIGGVALIRAAAKNHDRVTLVCDPADYDAVLAEIKGGGVTPETRRRLAVKGFASTAHYDTAIAAYLAPPLPPPSLTGGDMTLTLFPIQTLRYGENPHQSAALYSFERGAGPLGGKILQGKELSYNNLLDLDAAWKGAVSFARPTICIVKHLSPCGIASADELARAYRAAFECDKVSAFGGVIASNCPFDGATAETLGDLFVECIAAPGFTAEAKTILAAKKNCRLIEMPNTDIEPRYELRSITRGVLRQDVDFGDPPLSSTEGDTGGGWRIVSRRPPTESEWIDLRFAWKACQHVKSNAIVFAKGEATVGIGGGQPNRVDCVRLAAERAGEKARGAVMASDAFFPFPDSVELAARSGITTVVHPGGSLRDADSLAVADAANMAMVVTGVRHFRH
ncbi:MAG: bifunctional phosphoribosylaminoimidazolecarboxamide formyltransferase/IMP cyclohydrolase [Chloroflexi bacterium]|nr:bifunctional phosphoribosylaminoimidazolecarboxamide formyltransferase/IMP cyclohydrolase [Chloroflexota bacterium]